MARIPEHEVERLKKEISVQRLAEAQGVKLTRHGADLVGKCPFHDDRNPSLVIAPAKNLWHCLGACNAGGTAIDWVMKAQGVSFRHAVELLKEDHFSLAAAPVQPVKKSTVPKLPRPSAPNQTDLLHTFGAPINGNNLDQQMHGQPSAVLPSPTPVLLQHTLQQ